MDCQNARLIYTHDCTPLLPDVLCALRCVCMCVCALPRVPSHWVRGRKVLLVVHGERISCVCVLPCSSFLLVLPVSSLSSSSPCFDVPFFSSSSSSFLSMCLRLCERCVLLCVCQGRSCRRLLLHLLLVLLLLSRVEKSVTSATAFHPHLPPPSPSSFGLVSSSLMCSLWH